MNLFFLKYPIQWRGWYVKKLILDTIPTTIMNSIQHVLQFQIHYAVMIARYHGQRLTEPPAPPPTSVRRHWRIYRTYAKEHTNAKCGFAVCITTNILYLFASWRFIYFAPLDEWLVGICWSSKLQSSILQHTGHGKLQMPFCASIFKYLLLP